MIMMIMMKKNMTPSTQDDGNIKKLNLYTKTYVETSNKHVSFCKNDIQFSEMYMGQSQTTGSI